MRSTTPRWNSWQKRFTFGKLQDIDEQGVNFNGRRLRKVHDDILVDMKAFVEERMKTVQLSKERQKERMAKITEEERGRVRSVCGALNWAGREGRPDAAAAASMFSSQLMEMTVEDVIELNKVVQGLKKESELALRIQPIAESRLRWGVISDASWANARGGKTQAGHMLIAFDQSLLEGKRAVTNLLHWKSGKVTTHSEQHTGSRNTIISKRSWRSFMDDGNVSRAHGCHLSAERVEKARQKAWWLRGLLKIRRHRWASRRLGHRRCQVALRFASE